MPVFQYEAINAQGELVSGTIEKIDASEALRWFEEQRWVMTSLRSLGNEPTTQVRPAYIGKIEQALEHRTAIAEMLRSLRIEAKDPVVEHNTTDVLKALDENARAEDFLRQPDLSCWLPFILSHDQLASNVDPSEAILSPALDDDRDIPSDLVRLISYPALLFGLSIVYLGFLLFAIVPSFKAIFSDFQLRLPVPTQLLFGLSSAAIARPSLVVLVLAFFLLVAFFSVRFAKWVSLYLQHWPVVGFLVAGSRSNLYSMSRFTLTLAELLSIGAPKPDAIRVAGLASRRPLFQTEASKLADALVRAPNGKVTVSSLPQFPPTLIHALACGPMHSSNIPLLRQLAQVYRSRAESRYWLPPQIVGSFAIIALGGLIGMSLIALFMPMISLLRAISL